MIVSIKNRIYGSFFLLVSLFIVNGVVSIITLNTNRQLAIHVSAITDPSLQALEELEDILIASKMYTTNWVFLRSNQDDKVALKHLHDVGYPALKIKLSRLSSQWDDKSIVDSLTKMYAGFEQLLVIESSIMLSLQKFTDYDDPVTKLEAERLVEDEVLLRTSFLIASLNRIIAYEVNLRNSKNDTLEASFVHLRVLISALATSVIFIGIFLSLYMARKIINPINRMRHIVNDLGKGITRKITRKVSSNEIGEMLRSVNNLSEKLKGTAAFAIEIGKRNFDTFFEPLSAEDTLGIALMAMRDNIKSSDQKLNEAQRIAHLGSMERDLITGRVYMSDEMFNIFEIDPALFTYTFAEIVKLIHPDDLQFFKQVGTKYLQDREPVAYECRIITVNGITKNLFVQGNAVFDTEGNAIRTVAIIQDITERKRTEEKLAEEQQLLRLVIENIPDEIYLKDTMGRFILCNMPVVINAGCASQVEMIGKTDFDFLPLEIASQCFAEEQAIIESGVPLINHEEQITGKLTGKTRWNLSTKFPVKNNTGDIIGLIGINHDITRRKIDQQKLELVNRELNILFNSIDEVFFSVNMITLKVIQISATCEKVYGYTQSEFMANYKLWLEIIHPDDRHIIDNEDEKMRRGEQINNEYRVIGKDTVIRWIETNITPTLDETGTLVRVDGVTRDITERKKAEQSNRFKADLLNTIGQAVVATNLDGEVIYWNKAAEVIYGYSTQEATGNNVIDLIPSQQTREEAIQILKQLKDGQSWSGEFMVQRKGGATFPAFVTDSPIYDQNYKLSGIIGVSSDITQRKNAEMELNKSEERYRQIVETAQEGIWMIDEENNTTFVNKKMCEIIQYSQAEIIGKPIHDFMDDEANKNAGEQIERRKQGISETHDSKFITKHGKAVWTSLSTNPVFDAAGIYKGALAMITDITTRKQDEELLQRSQANLVLNNFKLEQKNKELEQFAYVASHDLQEPLRTTISFVNIFRQQYFGKIDAKADKYLNYIVQASDRMGVLIKDLLDFSRIGHNKDIELVDCNLVLHDVIADIDKAIKDSGADITGEHLPVINGYATELKQLFQNLLLNSIKFRKKNVALHVTITAQQTGDYWQFKFTDNGIGIDQQHNERIFIIFQRLHNRTEYQGSGIGLSHCKKIVELHHGKIWVKSAPGQGSTFYFTIHSKEKISEHKIKLEHIL